MKISEVNIDKSPALFSGCFRCPSYKKCADAFQSHSVHCNHYNRTEDEYQEYIRTLKPIIEDPIITVNELRAMVGETDLLDFTYTTTNKVEDKPAKDNYICPYCGTVYISDSAGFIPNCKNCGGKLERGA